MDITFKITGFEQSLGDIQDGITGDADPPIMIGEMWLESAGSRAMTTLEVELNERQHKLLTETIDKLRNILIRRCGVQ